MTLSKPLNLSFEEALRQLEQIVGQLEEGKLPLEESLRLYEEGKHSPPIAPLISRWRNDSG